MQPRLTPYFVALVLAGTITLAVAAPPRLKDEAAARKLYTTKCAKCHKFYDPASYSDAQWQNWMERMSDKAKLTPEQEKLLAAYIEQNLRSTNQERKTGAKR